MKRRLEETVVDLLSFSPSKSSSVHTLERYSSAEWERCLRWMDDAGLALYFLKAIEQTRDAAVPDFVVQRLLSRLHANEGRTRYMERQFGIINRLFEDAGIRYAAVKGLTLVPEFCPDASLRHQSDFDYLIDIGDMDAAHQLIEQLGYDIFKGSDEERIFILPFVEKAVRGDAQYGSSAPHSVELHLKIGHFPDLMWKEPSFLEKAVVRRSHGSKFHGLSDDGVFVLQAVHAFNHLLDGWMKLSWLYEIGHFLKTRAPDGSLWHDISVDLSSDPLLREAVAVIVRLASEIFQVRVPLEVERWMEEVRPVVLVWIGRYARRWAFEPLRIDEFKFFPANKLVLFLHRQYVPDQGRWCRIAASRLLALNGLKRFLGSATTKVSSQIEARRPLGARELRRIAFHLGSGIRYLWEIPRWSYLTRACRTNATYFERRCTPAS